ncbi:Asp-tRNA(Asn)/Glu-tRNA(Gln) amidotransferase subunit GatC [Ehrlichia ruminantium]|uniref:Asp-tRNA(Asn)/Glu-tRNA(Gln) amidotransferase subunit GatC n=1 Tax=Ehrlichia ruminantium TaxID=779 RepID=UPI000995988A|nr:Asp-tRNA(Asn)/Glu-tRNA(Gln) amidotransferase subunit GatC [Ehrlichia ruminantium]
MISNKLIGNQNNSNNLQQKKITKNDLLQVAKLVKVKLSDNEIGYYIKELESVLSWINTISQVNTDNVIPMSHGGIGHKLPLRKDIINDGNIKDIILSESPKQEHDFFVVPKVIE